MYAGIHKDSKEPHVAQQSAYDTEGHLSNEIRSLDITNIRLEGIFCVENIRNRR